MKLLFILLTILLLTFASSAQYLDQLDVDNVTPEVTEEHLHGYERLISKHEVPTATVIADTSAGSFYPYQLTAAADSTFGTAIQILGSDDTPVQSGELSFDLHKMFIVAANSNTVYAIRLYYGASAAAAEATGDYSDVWVYGDDTNPQQSTPIEIPIMCKRHNSGTLVWAACANAAGAQTIDLLFALHEYDHVVEE